MKVLRGFATGNTAAAAEEALSKHVDLTRFEDAQIDVDGLSLHFKLARAPAKSAMPIVLVHGLGLSCRYMLPTAQALMDEHAVLAPDLPGFGDSTRPDHVFTIDELADSLAAWIETMHLKSAVLLGNSLACQVIAAALDRHPTIATAAVLQGPTTPPNERSVVWQLIRWRQNLGYDPPDMKAISRDDYLKCGRGRVWKTFFYGLRDAMEDRLARIRHPILVVRGELDPICRRAWACDVARRLPKGKFAEIPGVAHTLVFTAPAQLAQITNKFVKQDLFMRVA